MTTTEHHQTTEASGHNRCATHDTPAAGLGPILDDPTLRVLAENVDDLENLRKASENRIRQLTRAEVDSDGEIRGHGLTVDHPNVVKLQASLDLIVQAEKMSVSNLERAMRDHPLGPWIKGQNGIGLKTTARLLSAIGDPYWNELHNRPRTVSELWAYSGLAVHGGYAQKRTNGQVSNWSDTAKMRVWNMVQPIIKNRNSPYRHLYDQAKAALEGKTYDERMAGKMFKGQPIVVGQPLSAGHIHAQAQRRVMKAILKDLWIESKRLHEERSAEIQE